jgi:hypothetical protein
MNSLACNLQVTKLKKNYTSMLRAMPATIAAGMLSEEGSEHNNKDVKKFMSNHARQFNQTARLSDTFHGSVLPGHLSLG